MRCYEARLHPFNAQYGAFTIVVGGGGDYACRCPLLYFLYISSQYYVLSIRSPHGMLGISSILLYIFRAISYEHAYLILNTFWYFPGPLNSDVSGSIWRGGGAGGGAHEVSPSPHWVVRRYGRSRMGVGASMDVRTTPTRNGRSRLDLDCDR